MKSANASAVGLAFVVGACAVFVFLTQNDPETVSDIVTSRFGWFVLAPATFLLCLSARALFGLSALCMVAGVVVGVCVRCLIPPHQSNLWPIAAVIWTVMFLLPIIAGAAAGGAGHWIIKKAWK